jgi:hypothetical protein
MGSVEFKFFDDLLSVGPVFGGEYFLTSHFSLGGEIALRWAISKDYEKPDVFDGDINERTYVYTTASLFIRFFL